MEVTLYSTYKQSVSDLLAAFAVVSFKTFEQATSVSPSSERKEGLRLENFAVIKPHYFVIPPSDVAPNFL